MPGEPDHRFLGCLDVLFDVLLQDFRGHAKRLIGWIEMFLLQVVTVVTIQVADGADRFGEDLELAGGYIHSLILLNQTLTHTKSLAVLSSLVGNGILARSSDTRFGQRLAYAHEKTRIFFPKRSFY
jgi:hypothetical protein